MDREAAKQEWKDRNKRESIGSTLEKHGLEDTIERMALEGSWVDEARRTQAIFDRWDEVKPAMWLPSAHKGERRMLPGLLEQEESIGRLIGGSFGPDLSQAKLGETLHTGVGVATDRRVLFVDKGIFAREVAELGYRSIEGITYSEGVLMAGMRITGRGALSLKIEAVTKAEVKPFVDYVRSHLGEEPHDVTRVIDDLERLEALRDRGILTPDEFEAKRIQLLS